MPKAASHDPEAAARFWRGIRNALNTPPEKPRGKRKPRARKAKK